MTDLANALDWESLNLLIAEPLAFIFDFGLLRFVHSYLKYLDKQRFLMKRFESFQFLYCSFMFVSKLNERIKSMSERSLRLVYREDKATVDKL